MFRLTRPSAIEIPLINYRRFFLLKIETNVVLDRKCPYCHKFMSFVIILLIILRYTSR